MKDSVESFQGRGSYREMQLCLKQLGTPVQVANEAEERSEKRKGYAEKGQREMNGRGREEPGRKKTRRKRKRNLGKIDRFEN